MYNMVHMRDETGKSVLDIIQTSDTKWCQFMRF